MILGTLGSLWVETSVFHPRARMQTQNSGCTSLLVMRDPVLSWSCPHTPSLDPQALGSRL